MTRSEYIEKYDEDPMEWEEKKDPDVYDWREDYEEQMRRDETWN